MDETWAPVARSPQPAARSPQPAARSPQPAARSPQDYVRLAVSVKGCFKQKNTSFFNIFIKITS